MEDDLGIPSALFAPPVRDSIVEMGKSQVGFMSIFALPLFQGVTGVMPAMRFSVDEMTTNKSIWESKIISGRETERLQQREVAPQLDSYRLTPRSKGSSHTASVPLSTGLSPSSHVKTPSGRHSPQSSLTTPTRGSPEESRRSSHGTIRHPVTNGASSAPNHTTHMVHAAPLSPPSSKGATLPADTQSESSAAAFSAASDIAAESERVEKRSSSSAYSSPTPLSNTSVTTNASSHSSKSQVDRGSSAATSSELQPRLSPASANMSITNGISASHLNARTCIARRRSADHSILAVLVTSSGQSLPKATATSGVASDHCQASHDPEHVRRRSSGKSSLPSSPEWASQINSPGHDLGAMTPTTAGTSFRSVESTEQAMSKGNGSVLPSPTVTDDGSERENGGANVVFGNGNGHGHMNDHEKGEKDRRKGAGHGYVTGPKQTSEEWTTSDMDSERERERERDEKERQRLRHRNSRWKLKFWKGGKRIVSEAV